MPSAHLIVLLVFCAVCSPRVWAASTPTPVAQIACSNGTEARIDQSTACPNVLFFAFSKLTQGTVQGYDDEQLEIYGALKAYVDATLLAEGSTCTGPHGTTLVTTVATIPSDLSMYTQIVRCRTCLR